MSIIHEDSLNEITVSRIGSIHNDKNDVIDEIPEMLEDFKRMRHQSAREEKKQENTHPINRSKTAEIIK